MTSKITTMTIAKSEFYSGILMIISFGLALIICNINAFSQHYNQLVFCPISLSIGKFIYKTSLINLVNDGLMTLFFLLIGLELKYQLILGEYQDRKTLILPTMAAIGGIIIPALIYSYFNFKQITIKG